FIRHQQEERQEILNELQSIATLKLQQLTAWRGQRLADALILMRRHSLTAPAAQFLAETPPGIPDSLRSKLQDYLSLGAYADVALADTSGRVRYSLSGNAGPLGAPALEALKTALHTREPVLTELHASGFHAAPHLAA